MSKLFGRGGLLQGPCAFVVATSFALSGVGCAHLPKTGAESTGEPLNVEVKTETRTYVTQAKVGEVVSRDSSGRVIGTSEVYENRVGQYDVTRWQAFQGDAPLDDQDFYRIAGDEKTAKEIAEMRQSGVSLNHAGAVVLAIGGALALTGIVLSGTGALSSTDSNGITTSSPAPTYMLSFGMVGASVGGVLMFYGAAKAKREHPIDDPERADRVARRYNKTLGAATATTEEEAPPPPPKHKKKKKKKKKQEEEDDDE